MPFPSGTFYDRNQAAIVWLLDAFNDGARYPHLKARARPKLEAAVDESFATWVGQAPHEEIPSIVLAAQRWRRHNREPRLFLDRIERALALNAGNAQELGNLTGNMFHPTKSSDLVIQCLTTVTMQDRAGLNVVPVPGPRPDIACRLTNRTVGFEVTSRNMTADEREALARGEMAAGSVDDYAEDDFNDLWERAVTRKLTQYDSTAPIVLVVWDTALKDLSMVLDDSIFECTFQQILDRLQPNCTPMSAFVILPYTGKPHVGLPGRLSSGVPLTNAEVKELKRLFEVNPAVECGFWPPEELWTA
jgi:hypothetical protein